MLDGCLVTTAALRRVVEIASLAVMVGATD
jgi:hypothetical protein